MISSIKTLLVKPIFRHMCNNNIKYFRTSVVLESFYEHDEKGGYKDKRPKPSTKQLIREGFKELKHEIALWKEEVKERFECDPLVFYRPGETDIVWKFGNEESLQRWVVTCDSDHNEGHSSGSLTLNKQGKGMLSGYLSTQVPKDGRVKRSGYCNIKTLRARVGFTFHFLYNICYNNMP